MSNLTEMKNAFRIKSRYVRRIKLLATIGWNQSPTSNVIDQQYRTWTWQDKRKIPNSSLKMVRRRRWTASVDSGTHSLMVSHDISLWACTRFVYFFCVAFLLSLLLLMSPISDVLFYHPSYIDLNLTIFLIGFRNCKMLPFKINLRLLAIGFPPNSANVTFTQTETLPSGTKSMQCFGFISFDCWCHFSSQLTTDAY